LQENLELKSRLEIPVLFVGMGMPVPEDDSCDKQRDRSA